MDAFGKTIHCQCVFLIRNLFLTYSTSRGGKYVNFNAGTRTTITMIDFTEFGEIWFGKFDIGNIPYLEIVKDKIWVCSKPQVWGKLNLPHYQKGT